MELIKKLMKKYRSFIAYAVFGVMTTVVNIAVFHFCYENAELNNMFSNVLAWVAAVVFAYLTNKVWVFDSHSWAWEDLKREISAFVGCRVATLLVDLAIMYVSVDMMHFPATLMKVLSNVIVIILNYVFSKLIIFKKK